MAPWFPPSRPLSPSGRIAFLLALLVIEILAVALMHRLQPPRPTVGFLLKLGSTYEVAWRTRPNEYYRLEFKDLDTALKFAEEELLLHRSPIAVSDMERVWIQDRGGSFAVLWKTFATPYLNRWTFHREDDARFFADSFRQGGYYPSPFGHSLLLVPSKDDDRS